MVAIQQAKRTGEGKIQVEDIYQIYLEATKLDELIII